ncbi:MAG: hypothetical protein LBK76_10425 [Verrucomicrobiales bacterium]|jgi:hypothetical protein|nr:hypothetical protein [Verrucomicrobiales bacterium]
MDREKKREWATYFKLHLDRQLKSRAKRQAVADRGVQLFIGGASPSMPFLKVSKSSYVKTWRSVANELVARLAEQTDRVEDCFNLLRPRIERETYARLAALTVNLSELDRQFAKRHGRPMTARERELYVNALKQQPPAATVSAASLRKLWLNSVVGKIRRAQSERPDNLQKAWASVVGSEAAMETLLTRVDALKGIAYCHSLSSARRHALQRNPALPALLGRQLKLPIKKIVFR